MAPPLKGVVNKRKNRKNKKGGDNKKMPAKTINMHGKIYTLSDEKIRTKLQAQKFAAEIREKGKVAFLNPILKKGKETTYNIYEAEKAIRTSSRKNVSSITLLQEYKKGSQSFSKFMKELEKAQEISKKEVPKKVIPKKAISKKQNSKKKSSKKNSKKK